MVRKITIIAIVLFSLLSCSSNKEKKDFQVKTDTNLAVNDIDFFESKDENDILIYIHLQESYILTQQKFNTYFQQYIKQIEPSLQKLSPEDKEKQYSAIKYSLLLQLIKDEIIYQEGLRNEKITISDIAVERKVSEEKIKISQNSEASFDQFLKHYGISYQEFELKIKKSLYKDLVSREYLKYMQSATPSEIENVYLELKQKGAFSQKYRKYYLIEFNSSINEMEAKLLVKDINTLDKFSNLAQEKSKSPFRENKGEMPILFKERSIDYLKRIEEPENLLFHEIWISDLKAPIVHSKGDRTFAIWVDTEEEKDQNLNTDVQQRIMYMIMQNKKIKLEMDFLIKSAKNYSFKIRYKGQLIPSELSIFLKKSIQLLNPEVQ